MTWAPTREALVALPVVGELMTRPAQATKITRGRPVPSTNRGIGRERRMPLHVCYDYTRLPVHLCTSVPPWTRRHPQMSTTVTFWHA